MNFEDAYNHYNKIIHYLLKSYQITYNYDEFYQLLLIKMWQLVLSYDSKKSPSLSSYLFTRLKYYLIDTFRKENNSLDSIAIETFLNTSYEPSTTLNDFNLILEDLTHRLTPQETQWLLFHIQGYKQYEIAQLMNLSLTTIKKIKASTKFKCMNKLNIF